MFPVAHSEAAQRQLISVPLRLCVPISGTRVHAAKPRKRFSSLSDLGGLASWRSKSGPRVEHERLAAKPRERFSSLSDLGGLAAWRSKSGTRAEHERLAAKPHNLFSLRPWRLGGLAFQIWSTCGARVKPPTKTYAAFAIGHCVPAAASTKPPSRSTTRSATA